MIVTKTGIEGLFVIDPKVFEDSRGYFFESYSSIKLNEHGIKSNFVQDNESRSTYGVLRGLHYQVEPKGMTKILRVTQGKILDVAVDIRNNSKTYGDHFSIELSAENKKQIYIPKGFAHGFVVLSEYAVVNYKCDEFYFKEHEAGILWNDAKLGIDWKIDAQDIILSEKDENQPTFDDLVPYSN